MMEAIVYWRLWCSCSSLDTIVHIAAAYPPDSGSFAGNLQSTEGKILPLVSDMIFNQEYSNYIQ